MEKFKHIVESVILNNTCSKQDIVLEIKKFNKENRKIIKEGSNINEKLLHMLISMLSDFYKNEQKIYAIEDKEKRDEILNSIEPIDSTCIKIIESIRKHYNGDGEIMDTINNMK
jgi:hypothetical protein